MKKKVYYLSPEECFRASLSLPPLTKKDLYPWLEGEVGKLYPGKLEDIVWDYKINDNRVFLYIIARADLKGIQEAGRAKYRFYYRGEKNRLFKCEDNVSPLLKYGGLLFFSFIYIFLTLLLPLRRNRRLSEELEQLERDIIAQKEESALLLERNEYYFRLEEKLSLLNGSSPPDLYDRIALFIPSFKYDGIITSLTIEGNSFTGHGSGDNPLLIVEEMSLLTGLESVDFEESVVDFKSGKDNFSWKGEFVE
ncbi:MAG: hypothetical protein PQJ59_09645 [Spirochaetales bacterium]|nr:hypothetical protein [Spirochaetales bacterium]